ncbi:MAG: M14 family metallopeptidase, partial [Actinomycetota bacterium]
IHAVELTATVAACRLIQRLVDGHASGDERIARALATRTFYIVPRVNPDGAEWALADRPRFRRSSTRPWPRADDRRWPGHDAEDIDGDGRILQMRLADPDGHWMPHPDDDRLLVAVPPDGPPAGTARYRLFTEGLIEDFDGFTVPSPRPPEGLDLNRNYPAGWGRTVTGSGDHPLSEPEIDALVRAIVARPNICGVNALHTSGGFLLRPSSTQPDSKLPPNDVWAWNELGRRGTELTGYPVHSVYEDFTWDPSETLSGASDDWAYEHLGVFGWTTEFWDLVHAATGTKSSTKVWYTGPTDAESLAALRWIDEQPTPDDQRHASWVDWYPFDHPQLGRVELGGWNDLHSWTNPPPHRLLDEVDRHADFAVAQALAAPCLEIAHTVAERLGSDADGVPFWQVDVGVANTGWLPTNVSARAAADGIVLPIEVELIAGEAASVVDGPSRRHVGQLAGAMSARFDRGRNGSPERAIVRFTVRAPIDSELTIEARHQRAGRRVVTLTLR